MGTTHIAPLVYIGVLLRRGKFTLTEAARIHRVTEPPP
jgi:hypothetical protein